MVRRKNRSKRLKKCTECGKPIRHWNKSGLCSFHKHKLYRQSPKGKAYWKEYRQRPEVIIRLREYRQRPEVKARAKKRYENKKNQLKEDYQKNKKKILKKQRKYREKNKERRKEYYQKNREQILKQRKEFRERKKLLEQNTQKPQVVTTL